MLDYGLTCLVVGNGPSLRDVSNTFLSKYPSFGSNRCYLKFIPTYYVAMNRLVLTQNAAEIKGLRCKKYIKAGFGINGYQLTRDTREAFSFAPMEWVNEGYTVTYVALQLAYWMGFRTVLLVGIDHRYIQNGLPNEKQIMRGDDPNHFDPRYFKGQGWHLADLEQSEGYYRIARQVYEADERQIINLTPNTGTDAFEKGLIYDYL